MNNNHILLKCPNHHKPISILTIQAIFHLCLMKVCNIIDIEYDDGYHEYVM